MQTNNLRLKYSISENEDHQSFFAERKTIPYFGVDWHYHEEYELFVSYHRNWGTYCWGLHGVF